MIWVDAHLSPALAKWITAEFGEEAQSVRDVGLRHAKDQDIFAAARQADAIVMTKDEDFVEMVGRLGPPLTVLQKGRIKRPWVVVFLSRFRGRLGIV